MTKKIRKKILIFFLFASICFSVFAPLPFDNYKADAIALSTAIAISVLVQAVIVLCLAYCSASVDTDDSVSAPYSDGSVMDVYLARPAGAPNPGNVNSNDKIVVLDKLLEPHHVASSGKPQKTQTLRQLQTNRGLVVGYIDDVMMARVNDMRSKDGGVDCNVRGKIINDSQFEVIITGQTFDAFAPICMGQPGGTEVRWEAPESCSSCGENGAVERCYTGMFLDSDGVCRVRGLSSGDGTPTISKAVSGVTGKTGVVSSSIDPDPIENLLYQNDTTTMINVNDRQTGSGTVGFHYLEDGRIKITQWYGRVSGSKKGSGGALSYAAISTTTFINNGQKRTFVSTYWVDDGSPVVVGDRVGGRTISEDGKPTEGDCLADVWVNDDGSCGTVDGQGEPVDGYTGDGTICLECNAVVCSVGQLCDDDSICPEGSARINGVCVGSCPVDSVLSGESCTCVNPEFVFSSDSFTCDCPNGGIYDSTLGIEVCLGVAPASLVVTSEMGSFSDLSLRILTARTVLKQAKDEFRLNINKFTGFLMPNVGSSLPCFEPWIILGKTYNICLDDMAGYLDGFRYIMPLFFSVMGLGIVFGAYRGRS